MKRNKTISIDSELVKQGVIHAAKKFGDFSAMVTELIKKELITVEPEQMPTIVSNMATIKLDKPEQLPESKIILPSYIISTRCDKCGAKESCEYPETSKLYYACNDVKDLFNK